MENDPSRHAQAALAKFAHRAQLQQKIRRKIAVEISSWLYFQRGSFNFALGLVPC